MIIYIIIGFLLATVGITVLNCVVDLISAITELAKAHIGLHIVKCNTEIEKLNSSQEGMSRAIGFATTFQEDEENG